MSEISKPVEFNSLVGKRVALLTADADAPLRDYLIVEDRGPTECGCHDVKVIPDPMMNFRFDGKEWGRPAVGSPHGLCSHRKK